MADVTLVDLVKITASTTGTGAVTLGSPVPGYRGVEALLNGAIYSYAIQQEAEYEVGTGTYLAAGNQFIRTPSVSSNGGTAIDLQPNAALAFVATAQDILGRDVLRPLYGYGAPFNDTGIIGQVYTDLTAPVRLYGPKTSYGWGAGVVLQGGDGENGKDGLTGPANSTYAAASAVTAQADTSNLSAIVADPTRGGTFAYKTGNYEALIASDTRRGISIPDRQDLTGVNGAWLRIDVSELNTQWFGAVGDYVANDTAAIQAAFDLAEFLGGRTVFSPRGEYLTSSALRLPANVRWRGEGVCSIIRPQACDGLHVLKSDSIAPRTVENLRFYANGGDNFTAISADIASPERVTGLVFENLFIDFFGTGVQGRGFWYTTFRGVVLNQVPQPFYFYDRSVVLRLEKCSGTRGTLVAGAPITNGVQIGSETDTNRPEDVTVTKCVFYGYSRGVYWRNCLYGNVTFCDLDYCTEGGIYFVTADGGTTFSNNWVQTDNTNSDVYGIRGAPLGSLPGIDNIEIHNNRLRATDVKIVPGEFHSFGLDFGNNQANLNVSGNSVQGSFQVALQANGVQRSSFRGNIAVGQTFVFNTLGVTMDGNYWGGGITLSGNVNANFGKDTGLQTTSISGTIEIPAGQTSATVTYQSLNMPDLPAGGYSIRPRAVDYGTLTHGGLSILPTRSAVTVYCEKAIVAVASTVAFDLGVY